MDLALALETFLGSLRARNYSPETVRIYAQGGRAFISWAQEQGCREVEDVTRELVMSYRIHLEGLPMARESRVLRARPVDRLFGFLVEKGELLLSPCEGLPPLPKGKRLPRVTLSAEEMKRILSKPNTSLRVGIRDRAILELLYSTGLRASELLGLKVYDVDLLTKVVLVKKPKGGRPRVVPLGKHAARWIREYVSHVRPRQARRNPSERALLLIQTGRPLSRVMLGGTIRKHVRAAGIRKRVTAHTFRHTLATQMMQAGADITAIQRILGHMDLRSTHIYTRVMPVDVKHTHEKTHPREK